MSRSLSIRLPMAKVSPISVPWSRSDGSESDSDSESEDEGTGGYRRGGYHAVRIGESFKAGRYLVHRKLGWGHFSTVWLASDNVERRYVALKVQKSAREHTEAAMDEIAILKTIAAEDPDDCKGVVKLLDHFKHAGPNGKHVCMVFEFLGDNLLTLMKQHKYKGLPLDTVRQLATQILVGLDFLHRELSMIHTDLKPENILLLSPLDPFKDPRNSGSLNSIMCAGGGRNSTDSSLVRVEECKEAITSTFLTKNKKKLKKKARKAERARKAGKETTPVISESDHENVVAGSSAQGDPRLCDHDVVAGSSAQEDPRLCDHEEAGNLLTTDPAIHPVCNFVSASLQIAEDDNSMEVARMDSMEYSYDLPQNHGQTGYDMKMKCKIVDLGNACWSNKQLTRDIQTREYRCPETLLGAKYSHSADMWSFACIVFELVTGDVLFDARRDEDHLAQMMELLGRMPRRIAMSGRYAQKCFNRHGNLKHIRKLDFWPLDKVLVEKYGLTVDAAQQLAAFLCPMLDFDPDRRPTAGHSLLHPWLNYNP